VRLVRRVGLRRQRQGLEARALEDLLQQEAALGERQGPRVQPAVREQIEHHVRDLLRGRIVAAQLRERRLRDVPVIPDLRALVAERDGLAVEPRPGGERRRQLGLDVRQATAVGLARAREQRHAVLRDVGEDPPPVVLALEDALAALRDALHRLKILRQPALRGEFEERGHDGLLGRERPRCYQESGSRARMPVAGSGLPIRPHDC
jgi:hypothetical protein